MKNQPPSASKPFLIDQPRQVRALRSPARQELIDAVQAAGPVSIAELGALLGRAPDSLYYHVRELVRLGLLVKSEPAVVPTPGRQAGGRRRTGRARGLLVDVPGRPMKIVYRIGDAARRAALAETVRSMMRLASRDFASALDSPQAVAAGPDRNLWAARVKSRLSQHQIRRLMSLLQEATEILVAGNRNGAARAGSAGADPSTDADGHGTLVTLTFSLSPVPPRRRRKAASDPDDGSPEAPRRAPRAAPATDSTKPKARRRSTDEGAST